MDSMREMARGLLRQYRRNHGNEAHNPVIEALQAKDDEETRKLYDVRLTIYDRAILKNWGVIG